ncbi:hypothetical protein [Nocardia stercoris]|uniref:hypothetical protein n=1 Tax=Nocardia stercoris TaxID=2483361 RepID=UPI001319DB72|nr:hypothetical protein [Nocardia stercoris]
MNKPDIPDLLLRSAIASSLALGGYQHLHLYRAGYRYIHVIGPSFLLDAAASFAVAFLVLVGAPWTLRVVAAGLAGGAIAGFVASRTVGIFGFTETGWDPAPYAVISVAAEGATIAFCVLGGVVALRRLRCDQSGGSAASNSSATISMPSA